MSQKIACLKDGEVVSFQEWSGFPPNMCVAIPVLDKATHFIREHICISCNWKASAPSQQPPPDTPSTGSRKRPTQPPDEPDNPPSQDLGEPDPMSTAADSSSGITAPPQAPQPKKKRRDSGSTTGTVSEPEEIEEIVPAKRQPAAPKPRTKKTMADYQSLLL